jgi:peptide/nickel transport system ATP-binding protein
VPEPVLCVRGLHVDYQVRSHRFEALHDIDLDVAPGRVHGVVGESGCGKSTVASAMMRLLPPNGRISSGSIHLEGEDLVALTEKQLRQVRGRQIGMIFQDPLTSLNPTFTISAQMVNAQRAHPGGPGSTRAAREAALEMLERVGIPDPSHRIDHYPHQFSGGMRQRIMIATALLLRPSVLICDEATSALDVTLQAQILSMLRQLGEEEGTALVIISHDIGVMAEMADDLTVLYAGRTVETGPAHEVLHHPQHPYTRKLLAAVPSRHRRTSRLATIPGRVPSLAALPTGCTFADRCYAVQDVCRVSEPELVEAHRQRARCLLDVRDEADAAGLGRPAQEPPGAAPASASTEDLLAVRDLRVEFGGRRSWRSRSTAGVVAAVDGVDLTLGRGEIVGLVGESGSGKTTLGKALLRLAPITDGQVTFEDLDLADLSRRNWQQMRRRMQMIFQEPYGSLSPRMRIQQLITEPYAINRTPAAERYSPDELLDLVGLSTEQATKYPHELSGGQARRTGIARALAMRPDLIVADEPTSGLDVSAAAAVLNLLRDLRTELSLTLLVITHDLNIVGYIADRVAVMHNGRIVEIGPAGDVIDDPQHAYTQQLLASAPDLPQTPGPG